MTSVMPRASRTSVARPEHVTDVPDIDEVGSAGGTVHESIDWSDLDAMTSGTVDHAEPADTAALSERQQQMLVFERQWWRHAGSKEQAIRDRFGLSATRYYQALNQLLDMPEALAFDPMVVGRLRRLRSSRSRSRTR